MGITWATNKTFNMTWWKLWKVIVESKILHEIYSVHWWKYALSTSVFFMDFFFPLVLEHIPEQAVPWQLAIGDFPDDSVLFLWSFYFILKQFNYIYADAISLKKFQDFFNRFLWLIWTLNMIVPRSICDALRDLVPSLQFSL